jgi:hypothetical protein
VHHVAAFANAAPTKAALVSLLACLRKAGRHDEVLQLYGAYANFTTAAAAAATASASAAAGAGAGPAGPSADGAAGAGAGPASAALPPLRPASLLPPSGVAGLAGWPVAVDYNLASHVCASCEATGRWDWLLAPLSLSLSLFWLADT